MRGRTGQVGRTVRATAALLGVTVVVRRQGAHPIVLDLPVPREQPREHLKTALARRPPGHGAATASAGPGGALPAPAACTTRATARQDTVLRAKDGPLEKASASVGLRLHACVGDRLVHLDPGLGLQQLALGPGVEQERVRAEGEWPVAGRRVPWHVVRLPPCHVVIQDVELLADELVVEGLGRQEPPELVGLLDQGEHLDGVHHADGELFGGVQLVRQVRLEGSDHPRLQKGRVVGGPPAHQQVAAGGWRRQHDVAHAGDQRVGAPRVAQQGALNGSQEHLGPFRRAHELDVPLDVEDERLEADAHRLVELVALRLLLSQFGGSRWLKGHDFRLNVLEQ